MDLNLRRLRAFVTVAEELHFTRAAKKLFLTQQSLSKQVADLEKDIGVRLLDRTSRNVELTAAGEAFLRSARDTLESFDRGVEEARTLGRGVRNTLRVGFIPGAALELTSLILDEFARRFPDARLELREFDLTQPTAGLMSGEVDVAFVRLPCELRDCVTLTLFAEPCMVGVGTRHELHDRSSITSKDLSGQSIAIGQTADQEWRDFWTASNSAPGLRPVRLVETRSQSEELEVIAAGQACSISPACLQRYSPHPGIRLIPLEDYPKSIVAVARRRSTTSPLAQGFADAVRAVQRNEVELVRFIESGGTGLHPKS